MADPNASAPTPGPLPDKRSPSEVANVNVTATLLSHAIDPTPIENREGIISFPIDITEDGLTIDGAISCFKNHSDTVPACTSHQVVEGSVTLPRGRYIVAMKPWKQ
jgi:hypothetical protein